MFVASSAKAKKRRKGAGTNINSNKLFNDVSANGIIVDDIIVDTTGDIPAGFDDNGNVDMLHNASKTHNVNQHYDQVS